MEDYTKYTLEGAISIFITILAYKLYRLRCNTSSKCCGDSLQTDLHNDGNGNINNIAI